MYSVGTIFKYMVPILQGNTSTSKYKSVDLLVCNISNAINIIKTVKQNNNKIGCVELTANAVPEFYSPYNNNQIYNEEVAHQNNSLTIILWDKIGFKFLKECQAHSEKNPTKKIWVRFSNVVAKLYDGEVNINSCDGKNGYYTTTWAFYNH